MQPAWPEAAIPAAREHSVSIDCSENSSWPGWGEEGGGLKAREIGYKAEQPVKLQRDPLTCPGARSELAMGMPLLRGRGAAPWVLSCDGCPDTLEPEKADQPYLRLLCSLWASGSCSSSLKAG